MRDVLTLTVGLLTLLGMIFGLSALCRMTWRAWLA